MRFWKFWLGWSAAVLALVAAVVLIVIGTHYTTPDRPAPSRAAVPAAVHPAPAPPPALPGFAAAGFQPESVTFVSAVEGWALGTRLPCPAARCPALEHTADGGRSWQPLPRPAFTAAGAVLFADARDGWAGGQAPAQLWSTHDGGVTWRAVSLPGMRQSADSLTLAAGNGYVRAAVAGAGAVDVFSSPVGADNWTAAGLDLPSGAGPVPTAQLVLRGGTGWLLVNNRVVQGGARLVGGQWQQWTPPCAAGVGPVWLTAVSATDLTAVCSVGEWAGQASAAGDQLYVSSDGGDHFAKVLVLSPLSQSRVIGAPGGQTLVACVSDELKVSTDHGYHWTVAYPALAAPADVAVTFGDSAFPTATEGFVVQQAAGTGPTVSRVLATRDAGRSWTPVAFAE